MQKSQPSLWIRVALPHSGQGLPAIVGTFYLTVGAIAVALPLGVVSAVWAQSFEQVNFFPTFFILPLTFLGGVFYSARALPPALEPFTRANPVFYMVDAVRYGVLGISDAPPAVGVGLVVLLAAAALAGPYLLLRSGWRLRS